jgi:hypothetical protein
MIAPMWKGAIFTLLCLCTPSDAASADAVTMGAGAYTCGQFADAYRNDPRGAEDGFFAWAQGYMSGLNEAAMDRKKLPIDMESMPTTAQEIAIHAYCDRHPLMPYYEAVLSVYNALKRVQPN